MVVKCGHESLENLKGTNFPRHFALFYIRAALMNLKRIKEALSFFYLFVYLFKENAQLQTGTYFSFPNENTYVHRSYSNNLYMIIHNSDFLHGREYLKPIEDCWKNPFSMGATS